MTTEQPFTTLVRHELKWSRYLHNTEGKNETSRWTLFYIALAIVCGLALFTFIVMKTDFKPQYMWYFTFWLPWMAFGFAIHMVTREWQHHTFGWWLALPSSRTRLVAAKFVAIFLQACIVVGAAFAGIILLSLYCLLLPGHQPFDLSAFLLWGLLFFLLFTALFPFMSATGILFGILTKSRKKMLLPLLGITLWVVAGGFYWQLSVDNGGSSVYTALGKASSMVSLPLNPLLIGGIVCSWVATWLMIVVASRLLERDLNV